TVTTDRLDLLAALLGEMRRQHRKAVEQLGLGTQFRRVFLTGGGAGGVRRLIPAYADAGLQGFPAGSLAGRARLFPGGGSRVAAASGFSFRALPPRGKSAKRETRKGSELVVRQAEQKAGPVDVAGVEALVEPALPLLRGAVRERVGHHAAARHLLQPVVA